MGAGTRLDSMTTVFFMAPVCMAFCGICTAVHFYYEGLWPAMVAHSVKIWHLLPLNALLAFFLNIIVAKSIATFNGVGFLMAGICKDITIVVSAWLYHEVITVYQVWGFATALTGIVSYSLYKMNSDCFDDVNTFTGFKNVFTKFLLSGTTAESHA